MSSPPSSAGRFDSLLSSIFSELRLSDAFRGQLASHECFSSVVVERLTGAELVEMGFSFGARKVLLELVIPAIIAARSGLSSSPPAFPAPAAAALPAAAMHHLAPAPPPMPPAAAPASALSGLAASGTGAGGSSSEASAKRLAESGSDADLRGAATAASSRAVATSTVAEIPAEMIQHMAVAVRAPKLPAVMIQHVAVAALAQKRPAVMIQHVDVAARAPKRARLAGAAPAAGAALVGVGFSIPPPAVISWTRLVPTLSRVMKSVSVRSWETMFSFWHFGGTVTDTKGFVKPAGAPDWTSGSYPPIKKYYEEGVWGIAPANKEVMGFNQGTLPRWKVLMANLYACEEEQVELHPGMTPKQHRAAAIDKLTMHFPPSSSEAAYIALRTNARYLAAATSIPEPAPFQPKWRVMMGENRVCDDLSVKGKKWSVAAITEERNSKI